MSRTMRIIIIGILAILLLLVVGGGLYMLLANPKPSVNHVEKTIPRESLPG